MKNHRSFILVILTVIFFIWAPNGAMGTVEEQRARLPPPAECADPIEGVWQSFAYDTSYQDWTIFKLEIHRDEENRTLLRGEITNETWYGDDQMTEPGPCEGLLHYFVHMDSLGNFDDETNEVVFAGQNWSMEHVYCGTARGFRYNLDRFSGIVDPELQEFQSVNNDGGRAVNDPTVFRRIECFDSETEIEEIPPDPSVRIQPPSLYPRSGMGCNRRRR